jgi:hypothetical protein
VSPYPSGHDRNRIHTLYEIVSSGAKQMDTICGPRNAFPTEETRGQPCPFGPKSGGMERESHVYITPNGDVQQRKWTRRYSRFFAPAPNAAVPKMAFCRSITGYSQSEMYIQVCIQLTILIYAIWEGWGGKQAQERAGRCPGAGGSWELMGKCSHGCSSQG